MNEELKKRLLSVGRWDQLVGRHSEDARILLDHDRLLGAIYLKGYAIECMLKRLITARYAIGSPPPDAQNTLESCFSGKSGHNLPILFDMAFSDHDPLKKRLRLDMMQFAIHWSVELRYSTGRIERRAAEKIIRLGDRIIGSIYQKER